MTPHDLLQVLHAEPFRPFRICTSDGSTMEVRHPELVHVFETIATIAIPGPAGPSGVLQRSVNCSLADTRGIEFIESERNISA